MSDLLQKSIASALRKGAGGDGTPTAEQAKLINGYTLRPYEAKDLCTREFVIAHNGIDRDRETIDEAVLERFALTLPGKGLFIKHPMGFDGDTGPGRGRWYDARTETMSLDAGRALLNEPDLKLPPDRKQLMVLFASMYTTRDEHQRQLVADIDAGIAKDSSIGFSRGPTADVIDPATNTKVATRLLMPRDAYESSLVWLGAQQGAGAFKNFNNRNAAMDQTEIQTKLNKAEADLAALKVLVEANRVAAEKMAALKTAFGTQAELLDNPTQLLAHVDAGKAFTNDLIDGIVAADRLAKRCGDTDDAVKAHRAMYAGMALPALKHLHGALVQAPAAATVAPGDPNATKATPADPNTKGAVIPALDFDA